MPELCAEGCWFHASATTGDSGQEGPCSGLGLHTLHFTLLTPHSTLYTLRFTLYTSHSPLHALHFTLHTLHSTLYILHSTLYTLHFTLLTPHSTLYTLHCTLSTPHSTLYTPHSALHTLHFTLHTLGKSQKIPEGIQSKWSFLKNKMTTRRSSLLRDRQLATNNVIEWQRIGAGRNLAGPTTPNGKKRGVEK